jgi:putative sterol carrier protein
MLEPERAIGLDANICFNFIGHDKTGLHIRNCIAKQTDGRDANIQVTSTIEIWADILTGATSLSEAINLGTLKIEGNVNNAKSALAVFDIDGLRS